MRPQYKQKCVRCRKNFVIVTRSQRYAVCYDCQKNEMGAAIKDPKMKKLFGIPEEFYRENAFLRDIKMNYIRYGNLTEKQIEAFKKTVEKMKEEK